MTVNTEVKAELTRLVQNQMKSQVAVQAIVQIIIQGIAYGTMFTFLWRLERTAHQVLETLQVPSEVLQSLPRGLGF